MSCHKVKKVNSLKVKQDLAVCGDIIGCGDLSIRGTTNLQNTTVNNLTATGTTNVQDLIVNGSEMVIGDLAVAGTTTVENLIINLGVTTPSINTCSIVLKSNDCPAPPVPTEGQGVITLDGDQLILTTSSGSYIIDKTPANPFYGWWAQRTRGSSISVPTVNTPLVFIDTTVFPFVTTSYPGIPPQLLNHGEQVSIVREFTPNDGTFNDDAYTPLDDQTIISIFPNESGYANYFRIQQSPANGPPILLNYADNLGVAGGGEGSNIFVKIAKPLIRPFGPGEELFPNPNDPTFILKEYTEMMLTTETVADPSLKATRFPGVNPVWHHLDLLLNEGYTYPPVHVSKIQITSPTPLYATNIPTTTIYCDTDPLVAIGGSVDLSGFAEPLLNGRFTVLFNEMISYDKECQPNFIQQGELFSFTIPLDTSALMADKVGYLMVDGTARASVPQITVNSGYRDLMAALHDMHKFTLKVSTHSNLSFVLPASVPIVTVDPPSPAQGQYGAIQAPFGPPFTTTPVTGLFVLADPAPYFAATVPTNPLMAGNIAVCRRGGGVSFTSKVKNCQLAGAIAVVIVNNSNNSNIGGSDPTIVIPSAMIPQGVGENLIAAIQANPNTTSGSIVFANSPIPNQSPVISFTDLQNLFDTGFNSIISRFDRFCSVGSSIIHSLTYNFNLQTLRVADSRGIPMNDRFMVPITNYLNTYDIPLTNYLINPQNLWWTLIGTPEAPNEEVQSFAGLFYFDDPTIGRTFSSIVVPFGTTPPGNYRLLGSSGVTNTSFFANAFYFGVVNPVYTNGKMIGYLRLQNYSVTDQPYIFMLDRRFSPPGTENSLYQNYQPLKRVLAPIFQYFKSQGCQDIIIDQRENTGGNLTAAVFASFFGTDRIGEFYYTTIAEIGGGQNKYLGDYDYLGDEYQLNSGIAQVISPFDTELYNPGSVFTNCRVQILTSVNAYSEGDIGPHYFLGANLDGQLGNNTLARIYGNIEGRLDGLSGSAFNATTNAENYLVTDNSGGPIKILTYLSENGIIGVAKEGNEPVFTVNRGLYLKPSDGIELGPGPWNNSFTLAYQAIGVLPNPYPRLPGDNRPNPIYSDPTNPPPLSDLINWRDVWLEDVVRILL